MCLNKQKYIFFRMRSGAKPSLLSPFLKTFDDIFVEIQMFFKPLKVNFNMLLVKHDLACLFEKKKVLTLINTIRQLHK